MAENLFLRLFKYYDTGMKKKVPTVALIIETSRTFGRELVRGIMKYSRTNGPWTFPWIFYKEELCYTEHGVEREEDLFSTARGVDRAELEQLKRWRPDGIITRDSKDIDKLSGLNIPLFVSVGMNDPDPRRNNILTDDVSIGQMAAEHLLERGFRNFGFCGFDDMFWSRRRCQSFCDRITEAGFKTSIYKKPASYTSRTWFKEEKNLAKWLLSLSKPAGVMSANDSRGQHITEACAKAKLGVPYEVAVIGVDNDEHLCNFSNPPLSSVAMDTERGGYHACELLGKMMAGKKLRPQTVVISPIKVVTRQSTNIVAVEDKLVAEALHFINQNARRPLQIFDVMKYLKVSRSYLHQKFMNTLKRSVYDEIKRVRINLIGRMLLETDLPVSDIAVKLGFTSDSHIARYFEQKTGMSPMKFRKLIGHK